MASTMLMLDSHWMPFHARDRRSMNAAVSTAMMPIRTRCRPCRSTDDLQAALDLQGAEAQRGRGAEQGREDGEDVDHPAGRSVGPLADSG